MALLRTFSRASLRSLLALALAGLLATACSSGDVGAPSIESTSETSAATEPAAAEPASAEPPASGESTPSPEPACDYIGLSSSDRILLEVSMTNDSGALLDGQLNYTLYDDATVLLEGREVVTRLEAGESFRFFRNSFTEIPTDAGEIRCAITGFEDSFRTSGDYDEAAGGGCVPVEVHENTGTVTVDVTVVNQLGTPAELVIDFAVHDPDGVRLGSNNEIHTESVNPGDSIEFSGNSRAFVPDGLSVSDLTCSVIALDEW